jgi:hypothetical protein
MGLLELLLLGTLGWLVWSGRIRKPDTGQIAALILAVVGGAIAARGRVMVGGIMAIGGLVWLSRRPVPVRRSAGTIADDPQAREAFDLLGLPIDADRAAVVEAHRRLIARTHPDAGGTEALARNINAARDYLLGKLPR